MVDQTSIVAWASVEGRRRTRDLPPDFVEALSSPQQADGFWLNVRPDPVDFRDLVYSPGLVEIAPVLHPPGFPIEYVRDQGDEGSCTGQALAAAIDIQNAKRRQILTTQFMQAGIDKLVPERVSARMLYEMARTYDEFPDDGLPGSSVRGTIKGFFHNGVCNEKLAPYHPSEPGWRLTVEMAKNARYTSLGAYFRLRHVLYDYHAALNEVGSLFVSAMIHDGWSKPDGGVIGLSDKPELLGAHAFAIVGYDPNGFLVLNSWGPNWSYDGRHGPGIAHWSYADWKKHVLDAWVLRLAVPSENTFHLIGGYQRNAAAKSSAASPASVPRIQLSGHYIHIQNGRLVRSGNYWNDLETIGETADFFAAVGPNGNGSYRHLLFYAHGGLNGLDDAVARAALMTPVFKALKIYPVFFLWRTGLFEELHDVLTGAGERAATRFRELTDLSDLAIEAVARVIVRPIWDEMKNDAARAFARRPRARAAAHAATRLPTGQAGEGWPAAKMLVDKAVAAGMRVHFVGHSAGALLLGELLKRAFGEGQSTRGQLGTVSLFAPACTERCFDGLQQAMATTLGDDRPETMIYALTDDQERGDTVGGIYRKSLLYLVSNALEAEPETSLLGMENVALRTASRHKRVRVALAGTESSDATTHSGFDDDPRTLNHVINRVLDQSQGTINGSNGGFANWMFRASVPR